ncbi:hypothetical protein [Silvanigrella aquatica]|uniref:Autotransporter domain-containing protein n=1 Tax=Silvanigrella aquatica TaxID=1915309 RepID=A0A1L4D0A7_9BACT|nr:hypothetical protein [Silvanigrella aquatica]APJ03636.1 hypothetical protein AXG55_06835 [Silvanigrella aquatica]
MKKLKSCFSAFFVALIPCLAHAQNEVSNSPKLGQLTFIPEENMFLSESVLTVFKNTHETEYQSRSSSRQYEVNGVRLGETFSYSLKKNYILGINLDYYNKTEKLTITNSSYGTHSRNSGFENPKFFYLNRYNEQNKDSSKFNLDFIAQLSPDLIKPKEDAVASGNTQFALGVVLSQNRNAFIWNAKSHLTYIGKTSFENSQTQIDSYITFQLGGNGQYYFDELLGVDFGINLNFIPKKYGSSDFVDTSYESRIKSDVYLGLNYNAIPNKMNLFANIVSELETDYDFEGKEKYNQFISKYKSTNDITYGLNTGIKFTF